MSTYDLDVLKLAFARHVLDGIARADDEVDLAEQRLLDRLCPPQRLREVGLIDGKGLPTAQFHQARAQALEQLPIRLPFEEKLGLLTHFVEMAIVDGQLHRQEGSMMFTAAQLLAITPQQFDTHLESLTEHVGTVELDDALDE